MAEKKQDKPFLETRALAYEGILEPLDLQLWPGERVGLRGPNGSGKSTLLRILAQVTRPSSGQIYFQGQLLDFSGTILRKKLGYITAQPPLYHNLTGRENLEFYGQLYSVDQLEVRLKELAKYFQIFRALPEKVGHYSQGMAQRLNLVRLFLSDPELLLCDEPFTALDQEGTMLLETYLSRLKGSKTLLLVHHGKNLSLLTDRVLSMEGGVLKGEAHD